MDEPSIPASARPSSVVRLTWGALLLAWFVALCVIPDPRPLGAPEWAVRGVRSLIGVSVPGARAVATIALRGAGLALIGILLSLSFGRVRVQWALPLVLVVAPLLAVAAQWINYGYFPIAPQLRFGVVSVILGTLAGFVLRRSRVALAGLMILAVGLFAWGSSTGIPDDLYEAARATGLYLLENAEDVPNGDDGFASLVHAAFTFAADNSHGTDPVRPNQAAILALGVILGEDRVAETAKRQVDLDRSNKIAALRNRVTLRDRHDLSRHFWVSAALAILSDENRSMAVGIVKELMDATPGGSGFSFVDLTADRAGNLFAVAATRDPDSARATQARIRNGIRISDLCPDVRDLPEGISRDEFQAEYGGLGGVETQKIVEEIHRRLATCASLR